MKRKTPEQRAYELGFKRATMLMLGTNGVAWSKADRLLRNAVVRQFFGRKRVAK